MLSPKDRCILGVSGGADSMGLLDVLLQLNGIFNASYRVIHVNHGLRGAEAYRDADFVKDACQKLGVPCKIIYVDVNAYAARKKLSTEEAGRILRYEAFEKEAKAWEEEEEGPPVKIAVAHNKDDNVETIIMQLCRGSGLKGISGIAPVRGRIIRPLLGITRKEIEEFLTGEGVSWINDSTNAGTEYTRNRIRHEILPLLVSEVNAGAIDNITRAGRVAGEADEFISDTARKLLDDILIKGSDCFDIPDEQFLYQAPILQRYMIRQVFEKLSKSMKDVTSRHIEDVVALAQAETGKKIDLPYGLRAEKRYNKLRLSIKDPEQERKDRPKLNYSFGFKTFSYEGQEIPTDEHRKWFDADKIESQVELRYRRQGDKIVLGGVGEKLLRAYMTDAKIPQEERDNIPVVADGDNVIWLIGYRISDKYKIDENTRSVMEIVYKEGK